MLRNGMRYCCSKRVLSCWRIRVNAKREGLPLIISLLTCEISWIFHAQTDVDISLTLFFRENGKKIHGCIVLYPIRVVTIHAITDNYCIFCFLFFLPQYNLQI